MTDNPEARTCALSHVSVPGKLYVLKTTEGEELVHPEVLFHPNADAQLSRLLLDLDRRVCQLEERLGEDGQDVKEPGDGDGQEDEDEGQEDRVTQAAKAAAAPVKKTAAKKTPAQRRAAD